MAAALLVASLLGCNRLAESKPTPETKSEASASVREPVETVKESSEESAVYNPTETTKESAEESSVPEREEESRPAGIEIPGYEDVFISVNDQDSFLDIYNPKANNGYYSLTFELYVDKDRDGSYETLLYESGMLKGGQRDEDAHLKEALPEGRWAAKMFVQPYIEDTDYPLNNVETLFNIFVENR